MSKYMVYKCVFCLAKKTNEESIVGIGVGPLSSLIIKYNPWIINDVKNASMNLCKECLRGIRCMEWNDIEMEGVE